MSFLQTSVRILSENGPRSTADPGYFHPWLWLWPENFGPAMLVNPKIDHDAIPFRLIFMIGCGCDKNPGPATLVYVELQLVQLYLPLI